MHWPALSRTDRHVDGRQGTVLAAPRLPGLYVTHSGGF